MNKRWCSKHDSCMACGTTERKHVGRGLCRFCYYKEYSKQHSAALKAYRHEWYLANGGKFLAKVQHEQRYFGGNREAVLERDGYKCQSCGSEYQLCVHHKDGSGRNNPHANNANDNLVTLCKSCHLSAHQGQLKVGRGFVAIGSWSEKYGLDACEQCHKSDVRHWAGGLCARCYDKKRVRDWTSTNHKKKRKDK